MRIRSTLAALLLSLVATSADTQALDDAAIRSELATLVDVKKQAVGIVVGIVDENGSRILAHGALDQADPRPVDGDSVFEIGSITKVFTSLLLADMVRRGEVTLDDPVAKYLPADVKMPERGGRQITLIDLATHTSGLPRMPGNFMPKDPANPYADYTPERMYAFLSRHTLRRDIGAQFEYSNLGVGLLGHALARRAGMDYEALLRQRILEPLGMQDTAIAFTPKMREHLAKGHRGDLTPAANWDLYTLAGAGGIRSTANDLLKFARANLGLTHSALDEAMKDMRKVRRPAGAPGVEVALAWIVPKKGDGTVFMHNGGTGGYRSWLAIDLEKSLGIVVLTNASNEGAGRLGARLIGMREEQRPDRASITLDSKTQDRYTGRYRIGEGFFLDITREGGVLRAQATGQESFEIRPESQTKFFAVEHPIEITFVADGDAPAPALILHQAGMDTRATRFDPDAPPPAKRASIHLAPGVLDRYVGSYELGPMFVLDVTREKDRLYVQATAQPRHPVFAESEKKFFYTVVDAQITFETGPDGKATALTLHQGGRDMKAPRTR